MSKTRSESEKENRKKREKENAEKYKEYYLNNQNVLSTCKICETEKELKEFVINYSHRFKCKECHAKSIKNLRHSNPSFARNEYKKNYEKTRKIMMEAKDNKKCEACNKSYPAHVLDFHHLRDKEKNVTNLYRKGLAVLSEEIEKCVLLCANCHREETYKNSLEMIHDKKESEPIIEIEVKVGCWTKKCKICEQEKNIENFTKLKIGTHHTYCKMCLREKNQRYSIGRDKERVGKKFIKELKDNKPCTICKEIFRYWVLDYDHQGNKVTNINKMQNMKIDEIKSEIEKCVLLCANCHRDKSYKEKETYRKPFDSVNKRYK